MGTSREAHIITPAAYVLNLAALSRASTDALMRRLITKSAIKSTMKHDCPAIIAPSILSADLARLNDDSQQMLDMGADWLHWYVVLKCFVIMVFDADEFMFLTS
jgi:hypothetical protein